MEPVDARTQGKGLGGGVTLEIGRVTPGAGS